MKAIRSALPSTSQSTIPLGILTTTAPTILKIFLSTILKYFCIYYKEIDLISGKGVIEAFKTSFNNVIFNKMPNCVKTPSTNDTKRIK